VDLSKRPLPLQTSGGSARRKATRFPVTGRPAVPMVRSTGGLSAGRTGCYGCGPAIFLKSIHEAAQSSARAEDPCPTNLNGPLGGIHHHPAVGHSVTCASSCWRISLNGAVGTRFVHEALHVAKTSSPFPAKSREPVPAQPRARKAALDGGNEMFSTPAVSSWKVHRYRGARHGTKIGAGRQSPRRDPA
jgi:hypothetical protein